MVRAFSTDPYKFKGHSFSHLDARHHVVGIKPNFHHVDYDRRHDVNNIRPYVKLHSPLNPVQDITAGQLLAQQKSKQSRRGNLETMDMMKIHVGKTAIALGVDKFVSGKEPTLMTAGKDVALFFASDIIQDKLLDAQIDKLLGDKLSQSNKDMLSALIADLSINSAINRRMPNKNDLIKYGLVEGIDMLAFSDKFDDAGFQRVQY